MRYFLLALLTFGLTSCVSVEVPFEDYGTFQFGFVPDPEKLAEHGVQIHPVYRDK